MQKIEDGNKTENGMSLHNMLREELTEEKALPYERFLRYGPKSLTEAELLAIIIRTGTKTHTPVQIGQQILKLQKGRAPSLQALFHVSVEELMQVDGIGKVKAVKLKCIAELSRRIAMAGAGSGQSFKEPYQTAKYYMEQLRHEERERVLLLCLDTRMHLLSEEVLSIGTVNCSLLSPREVFIAAMRAKAVFIVLMHNHPGGDPTPSEEDLSITTRVEEVGEMTGIRLADHIIIGDGSYVSFKELGLLCRET